MNQVITIHFAHAPQCQMHGSCHSAIMAEVCIATSFEQFFEVFREASITVTIPSRSFLAGTIIILEEIFKACIFSSKGYSFNFNKL